jgi:predicted MFS family arabinose efflux permease
VASFLAVIVALSRLRVPAQAERPRVSLGESLRQGLRHVAGSRALSGFTLLGLAGSFLAFPLITYMPVIADEVTGSGAAGYSLLLSSFGAGAIAGALATAQRGHGVGRGRLLLLAFVAYAVATVGVVLSRRQWLSMALLLVAGFALVSAFSTLNSFVQEHAEEALRGRILSIYGLAFRGGNPLGSLAAGALAQSLGTPAVIGGFAALLGLVAATVWLRRPELRRL